MSTIISALLIILFIFYIVILWKFAIKTGRPGWSLFIPIYSNFVWCNIAKLEPIWCIFSFIPSIVLQMYPNNIGISIICCIFSIVVSFEFCYSLAERFDKGYLYAIGLLILNPIFITNLTLNKKCIYREY